MNRNYYGEYRTLHEDKPNGYVGFDDPFKEDIEYALRYRQLTEDFTTGEFSGGHTKRKTVTEYSTDMCSVTGKTTVKIDKSKHINLFALLFTIFVIAFTFSLDEKIETLKSVRKVLTFYSLNGKI